MVALRHLAPAACDRLWVQGYRTRLELRRQGPGTALLVDVWPADPGEMGLVLWSQVSSEIWTQESWVSSQVTLVILPDLPEEGLWGPPGHLHFCFFLSCLSPHSLRTLHSPEILC